ncbi:MAG: hypothetical protein ACKOHG_01005 [Planctomycetia bacterium]
MERYDRIASGAGEGHQNGGQSRFLPAACVVVAAFSFMLTTVVWRLVRQTGAVEAAVHESIRGIDRLGALTSAEMAEMQEGLAGQRAATERLASRLAAVEATATAGLERVQSLGTDVARQSAATEQVRLELERAASGISQARQEILERLAVHAARNAAARDAMVREVNTAITEMERSLLEQAEEFQHRKQQLDAAAERDRAVRRAMLHEATQSFSLQVEGLRQLLDGLRVQAAAVDGDSAEESVKAAAEVTEGHAGEDAGRGGAGKPATAALDVEKDAVLE